MVADDAPHFLAGPAVDAVDALHLAGPTAELSWGALGTQ